MSGCCNGRVNPNQRMAMDDFMKHLPIDAELKAGLKYDEGKANWDLMPFDELTDVVSVLTHGADKYGAHNWQLVKDAESRYFAAAMRHLVAWKAGEYADKESELPHLAHAICNLIFLHWGSKQYE